ncbi:MAG: hypothetical protein ACJ8EY_02035, partial [Sphingomicrobium sp.]
MGQVSKADEHAQQERQKSADVTLRSALTGIALQAAVGICVLTGLLLFYGSYYSIHQDLAGGVLTGRLALALGDSFPNYCIY